MTEEKIDYSKIDFTKEIPFIRKRCPYLQGKELEEAEELFREYIRMALNNWERWQEQGCLIIPEEDLAELDEETKAWLKSFYKK